MPPQSIATPSTTFELWSIVTYIHTHTHTKKIQENSFQRYKGFSRDDWFQPKLLFSDTSSLFIYKGNLIYQGWTSRLVYMYESNTHILQSLFILSMRKIILLSPEWGYFCVISEIITRLDILTIIIIKYI